MDVAQNNGPADEDDAYEWDPTMDMTDEQKREWQHDILPVKKALLKYRPVVEEFTAKQANGLWAFELTEEEWSMLGQLVHALKPLKDAAMFFSCNIPSPVSVIPVMDGIDQIVMTSAVKDQTISPAIKAALSFGKRTLNKYYKLTDTSLAYATSMILHPSFKTAYFRTAQWKEEWITNAVKVS
ncbi:hypothetical protein V5O48_012614 [Marasmius crinis-equi]|uniref:Uncharacterized protein n=1 Tax=Marasmius crinis-equi TaxID=585013 RepID=A0ABR3F2D5_9AGAR